MSANPQNLPEITDQLIALLGAEHVLLEPADREFYAMDVYNAREVPMAVVQPGSVEDVQAVARIASAAGVAMVPRGGGASYTDGYLPTTARSVIIDTGRLNRILEVNAEDMYVTVEPVLPGLTSRPSWPSRVCARLSGVPSRG